ERLRRLLSSGQWAKAEAEHRAALEQQRQSVAQFPEMTQLRRDLVQIQFQFGTVLFRSGKRVEGEVELKATGAQRDELAAEFPDSREDACWRALTYFDIGDEYERAQSYAESADWFGRCLPILAAVQARWPDTELSGKIGETHCRRARAVAGLGNHAE